MDPQIEHNAEGWWFYDETWAFRCGPYPSAEAAQEGLREYARTELEGLPPTPGYTHPTGLRWE